MTPDEFRALVATNPINTAILDRLPDLAAPDAWLVSGALFQTVWNALTGRPAVHGILDYDVFYFDPDTSWAAEDAVIRRGAALFADLSVKVEIRNQARVHLWYTQKYAEPYPPLTSTPASLDRFLATACMVGLHPRDGLPPAVCAPVGFADLAALIVRPNRAANFNAGRYLEKAERWRTQWPELTVLPPDAI